MGTKISELLEADSVSGNDVIPIVSDEATKKVKVSTILKASRTGIAIGNYSKFGKLVVLNISTTELKSNVANNSKVVLATLDSSIKPKEALIVNAVVGKDETYSIIPNCYVLLRSSGDLEFYQASGTSKNVKQILGQISYFIE